MKFLRVPLTCIVVLVFCVWSSAMAEDSGVDPYGVFYLYGMTREQYATFGLRKLSFEEASGLANWLTDTLAKRYHCATGGDRSKISLHIAFDDSGYSLIRSGVTNRLRAMPDLEVVEDADHADLAVTVFTRPLDAQTAGSSAKVIGYFSFIVGLKQCKSENFLGEEHFGKVVGSIPIMVLSSDQTDRDVALIVAEIDTNWLEPERNRRAEIRRQYEE